MSTPFRLCSRAPNSRMRCGDALAARRRHRNAQLAAQVLRRQRARLLGQPLERARIHHAAAVLAGAQAHVDEVIGDGNHVGVVLDDEHGVALIAELPEDGDQPLVVARVQADRRLVEHVERADQRRAERRGQVDALRLAARQRRRQPVEREVVEADVAQEAQAPPDLLQHLVGDRRFLLGTAAGRRRTARASRTVRADALSMVTPPTCTSRASRRRRVPPQSGHVR